MSSFRRKTKPKRTRVKTSADAAVKRTQLEMGPGSSSSHLDGGKGRAKVQIGDGCQIQRVQVNGFGRT